MSKENSEGCWISLVLRAAVASLFVAAVVPKWMSGPEAMVEPFRQMFKDTWLPMPLVEMQARIVPYIETIIPIWLLTGRRLREAWILTALFLTSLSFGMAVAKQNSADIYLFVLIACVGLYFSSEDKFVLSLPTKKRK